MSYEDILEEITETMAEKSQEIQIGYQIDRVIAEIDGLCHLAADRNTCTLLKEQDINNLVTASNRLLNLWTAQMPARFRIIRHA